jgi:hypothetical protein
MAHRLLTLLVHHVRLSVGVTLPSGGAENFRVAQVVTSWGLLGQPCEGSTRNTPPAGRTPRLHSCPSEMLRFDSIGTVVKRRAQMRRLELPNQETGIARGRMRRGDACRATVAIVRRYRRDMAVELRTDSFVDSRMRFSHTQCERVTSRRVSVRSDSEGGFAVTSAGGGHIF